MAREMVVTRTRIVGRFVRLGKLYFLCYSKATLSLSLLPPLALYIFMRNYAKTRGENISTRHRYLTSLTISLYVVLRSSSWIATRDNFSISGRFLIAQYEIESFFFKIVLKFRVGLCGS